MKLGRYDRNTNYQDFVLLEQKKQKNRSSSRVSLHLLLQWGREQGVLVRGGTRPTPSVLGVADVASTSRRAVALPVLSLLPARGNTTGVRRQSGERQLEPEGWGISAMSLAGSRVVSEKALKQSQGRRVQQHLLKLWVFLGVIWAPSYRFTCKLCIGEFCENIV